MPPHEDPVSLHTLLTSKKNDNDVDESTTFMEQALGSIVTRGLREVSENRLKYPNLTVKETMLKLFALFLKAENPGNTAYMKEKYVARIRQFVNNCEIAEELSDLAEEKSEKEKKGKWPEFKEKYYNELGAKYDKVVAESLKEKQNGFQSYLK
jgi:adenylate/nucleoside-diphosphate kinase